MSDCITILISFLIKCNKSFQLIETMESFVNLITSVLAWIERREFHYNFNFSTSLRRETPLELSGPNREVPVVVPDFSSDARTGTRPFPSSVFAAPWFSTHSYPLYSPRRRRRRVSRRQDAVPDVVSSWPGDVSEDESSPAKRIKCE